MADNGEVIVGAGARLEGNVVSAGNLRIDGQVKGQINAEGDVSLSPQSQVEADIRAQNVSIAGRFKGFDQRERQGPPRRGGRIDGDITSKTLVVEEGGVFHGQSIMDGSSQPEAARGRVPSPPRSGPTRVPRVRSEGSVGARRRRIREDPEPFRAALGRRGMADKVDQLLAAADERRRSLTARVEELRAEQNRASKAIGAASGDEKQQLIEEVGTVPSELKELEPELTAADDGLTALLAETPTRPTRARPTGSPRRTRRSSSGSRRTRPRSTSSRVTTRSWARSSACSTPSAARGRRARASCT